MALSTKKSSIISSSPSNTSVGVDENLSDERNGLSSEMKDDNVELWPVEPVGSGYGLPYAPDDWPSPGDTWGWRVGKRVSNMGYYADRFLYLPERLSKAYAVRCFSSKASIWRFMQAEFPSSDVNAFFASFCWKIPAKMESLSQLKPSFKCLEFTSPEDTKKVENGAVEVCGESSRKRKQTAGSLTATYRCRTRQSLKTILSSTRCNNGGIIDLCSLNEASISLSTSKDLEDGSSYSETEQVSEPRIVDFNNREISPEQEIGEDFDSYLNSLDDILAPPNLETQLSQTVENTPAEDEMAESRRKLSSFLIMDFPSLAFSENLLHMEALASKILEDPTLSVDELIKLKLIQEIPLVGKAFSETSAALEKSNNFFAKLDANKARVSSLKEEYKEKKEKISKLLNERDCNTLVLEDIDDQIAQLQLRRDEISGTIERQNMEAIELISAQNLAVSLIPELVREIQEANSERAEWEVKKTTAAQRLSEFLAKYACIKGYSFQK